MVNDGHIHIENLAAHRVAEAAALEGAARWSVLSLSQYHNDPVQNLTMLHAKALAPEQCYAFFGLDHPKAGEPVPDYLSQAKLWMAAGFDGLKLIETKPNCARDAGVRLDASEFDPMFAWLEENEVPILWHNGDPAPFWDPAQCSPELIQKGWAYCDGTYPSLEALYGMVERVLDRHPRLHVTFAHFYFVSDDPAHAERMFAKYPNVHFDLTPGTEMYGGFTENADFFRPFFLKYAHRIQYGTDLHVSPEDAVGIGNLVRTNTVRFLTTEDEFQYLSDFSAKGFGLPEETVNQILANTFVETYGEKPRPLSPDGIQKAADYVLALLKNRSDPAIQDAKTTLDAVSKIL